MTAPAIDSIIQRKALVLAALHTTFDADYIVRGGFTTQRQQMDSEQETGILMLMSSGEKDYTNDYAMQAKEGTQALMLVAHFKAKSGEDAEAVELREMTLIEQVKQLCRTPIPGIGLELIRCDHSIQQAYPYGWVGCVINVVPPYHSLNK
jgi:hypothetical protein